ncbi:GRIP and coiled-coil domain-containing protein 2 isoform X2 [Ornithorhynchus anatinus]|uniref:GRIP and coiled-coil domain-containing protein 2 isoform X2 n=1 Tax=Ornithorhynchus anatinus TaxID=9258 RepID=UPI0019D43DE1|nr:GRIP and coiled-coil domain-containing protein 2 isoform X2 [Ornithorhynchus anatinus]
MEETGQDGVSSPATPGTGKSKLDTLPKEDLIKFARKQMMLIQKVKSRCTELEKEVEELKSKPAPGGNDDVIQVLTARLDVVLLEKAESQQQCVTLKKENAQMKQAAEDSMAKMEDQRKGFERSTASHLKEIESLKNELLEAESKHKADITGLRKELEEALSKQSGPEVRPDGPGDSRDDVKSLQEEIRRLKPAYEERIFHLKKALEAAGEEKSREVNDLHQTIRANSQHHQSEISRLQEELGQLKGSFQEEAAGLRHQLEASAKEYEEETSRMNQARRDLIEQWEAKEKDLQEKYELELETLRGAFNEYKRNQAARSEVQDAPQMDQGPLEEVKRLEDRLKELESQHSILKDEVTYMNNLKLKLELEVQSNKEEFFHEREDLEFKVNELQLAKEDQCCLMERLKLDLEAATRQYRAAVEQQAERERVLLDRHQREISELRESLLSDSEREKLSSLFEIQRLKEQRESLQREKEEAVSNYETLRETLETLQLELGESAGKISREFESMKQQQASDVQELQRKLRAAFNEKDALLETVNRLRGEAEKLSSQREEAEERAGQARSLREKNEEMVAWLTRKDSEFRELQAKISALDAEKDHALSEARSTRDELGALREKYEREEKESCKLRAEADQFTRYKRELEQRVKELTDALEKTPKEKEQSDQKGGKFEEEITVSFQEQEKLSADIKVLQEENERLQKEKEKMSRELEALASQKEGDLSFKEQAADTAKKLQEALEEKSRLDRLLNHEQTQASCVKAQLMDFVKRMGPSISVESDEDNVDSVLQALSESVAKINEEKESVVLRNAETVLGLQREIERLQEENLAQDEEFRSLLKDHEKEKDLLKEELEGTLSEKQALQVDLLEMKDVNEKTRLENQDLIARLEEVSQKLESEKEEVQGGLSVEQQGNPQLLLERKEAELQDVRTELTSLKDSLRRASSVKTDQQSAVTELEDKIVTLEKESKEKDEKLNKIKVVAVKARKELEASRKEAQGLRVELESIQLEKEQLSASMRDLVQGAEGYKNLLLEYDKQAQQLDVEKERSTDFERQIEDLTKQLRTSGLQCDKLSSDNEDLLTRIETLQSNAKLLEAQILDTQKSKAAADKELEAEKLQKEQKIKEHAEALKELEELQQQLQKERKQLQKTLQELELVRKDAKQTTLMDMEIADYERLVKELNQKITDKNSQIEEFEQEVKIQKQKQETLQEEITSLQSSVEQYEEKNTKIKQLLVKTKKELADSKQAETDHLILQSSLKGELEASQQQLEVYKIQLAEMTSEKHKVQEHLRNSVEQHQRTLSAYQQKITTWQEECSTAKAEQAAITSEFESYKVRVHNVLKQQKNKSAALAETEGAKKEREHLEVMVDQLKIKLQDTQNNLQANASELQLLQSEHDTLLERHNKMLQETVVKEAELREKFCSIQSENMVLKSEQAQTVSQLTGQNEALRTSFRDQIRHLQEEHRKTVETLQQQLSKVETQLFQLKSEPTTRTASHQPAKNIRERRNTDLPPLDMHTFAREEGEGMETTDTESVSSTGTHTPSLEQLLNSTEAKLGTGESSGRRNLEKQSLVLTPGIAHLTRRKRGTRVDEPPQWHAEFTREELVQKLSTATKSTDHLNSLLRETEATNAILMEQIKVLKNEIRRLERNQEREKSVANLEYLKNVLLQFIFLKAGSERKSLLPVIDTMLQLSPEEKGKLVAIAQGEEESGSSHSGWTSYLHSWSGLR